ncbi:serrate RNA effector molecule [Senna tora]|uniref:Serrate RNA effector molecule n=1 Tax=Senna tora TaxID=362788 RepID=A0A834WJ71_9FABA|nr:serrate RNA effector molecule [Senna tora]
MADVMNIPADSLDKSPSSASASAPPAAPTDDDLPPPPPPPPASTHPPPQASSRRRDRDSRDRRDDRDFDRHVNRRGGDFYDRNMSPPPPPRDRDRDFKRRRSPSPSYRDRRYSPPRRSPPPYKRSRRGSPRGGYGPGNDRPWHNGRGSSLQQVVNSGNLFQATRFLSFCVENLTLQCNGTIPQKRKLFGSHSHLEAPPPQPTFCHFSFLLPSPFSQSPAHGRRLVKAAVALGRCRFRSFRRRRRSGSRLSNPSFSFLFSFSSSASLFSRRPSIAVASSIKSAVFVRWWRFGYDYFGGYERGAGGRPGHADEKPYGRFAHRSAAGYPNGISDLESNHGYPDLPSGGTQREGLMSYKQFIQELEDDILPSEAERRYQEYKSEYITTQKRAYFNAHKDEEWLKDKYHPTNLLTVIDRRNENARQLAKDFLLDLQSGTLDLNPGLNASSSSKAGQASEPNSEEEADAGGKRRRHDRGPNKENDFAAAPKAHPISSEPRRVQTDIEQALALVRKLDSEKGIEDNILSSSDNMKNDDKGHSGSVGPIIIIRGLTSVKGLEGVELLDTLLTYLWQIHGVDYYGMIETNEAKGFRHVRPEGGHEEASKSGSEWEKKLDSFWQQRLSGQDPLEIMTAKEKIDAAAVEVLDPHVRKIRDEKYGWKYGCGAKGCTKLFHAAEFVHKHLKLKHPELVMELTSKLREDLYFQNYMNDSDAPGGTPVMQQPQFCCKILWHLKFECYAVLTWTWQKSDVSASGICSLSLKDRPLKRRLGLEGRLRDDRGNRRDHDRGDRINDGDRSENSPSRDRQSTALEMGNHDEAMFDAYAGSAVPPFASDMPPPPPVLMPVPGAGPLGPFVPAPPEVAMQMLREQGPSSYDNSGRKMRSGPHMGGGGPGPIIAVPPAFRPDPRRMRSYQDLDAPEDEVTVIDYRMRAAISSNNGVRLYFCFNFLRISDTIDFEP